MSSGFHSVCPFAVKGRRIAALAADGFEKVELVIPMKALQAAGAEVDVISLRHGRIRGVNLHEPASRVHVDKTIAEANPDDYGSRRRDCCRGEP
jgi:protease I